jgi:Cysteine-rich secretory protein family/Inner membrane component of T3SS, cytoplasmic domain
MLTFQILDGGETYYRPLDDRPVRIGTGTDADIHLNDPAVAPTHVVVEPCGEQCKLRVVGDAAAVMVNDMAVREADLALGDRITIGESVLVLGTQVKRPATAADVLGGNATRRRPPFEDKRSGKVKRMYALVALVGIAVSIGVYNWGLFEVDKHLPLQDRETLIDSRRDGRFDEARGILDRLDAEWVRGDQGRRQLVDSYRRGVEATAAEFGRLKVEYMARVLLETKAEQLKALTAVAKDATLAEKEAARILRAGLTEFRIAAEKVARANGEVPPGPSVVVAAKDAGRRKILPKPLWLDARMAAIRRLSKQKEHLQAWETARQILPDVPSEHSDPLRDLLADVRAETRKEMKTLVDQAFALRASGRLKQGVRILREASIRFPAEGELSLLYRVLGSLSSELGVVTPARIVAVAKTPPPRVVGKSTPSPVGRKNAVSSPAPQPQPQSPQSQSPEPPNADLPPSPVVAPSGRVDKSLVAKTLDEVRAAEAAGDLDKALSLLDKSVANHADYQPKLAAYLRGQVADLKMIRDLATAVAGASAQVAGANIRLRSGERATVKKVEGQHVHVVLGGQPQALSWMALHVEGAAALAAAAGVPVETRIGVAALGYRQGDAEAAEAYLARLLASDTNLFGKVSVVIGRGRGEAVDADGYVLVNGEFVAKRFLLVEKLAAKFERQLSRISGQSADEREKVLVGLRASEAKGTDDAIALALKNKMEAFVQKLSRSNLPKALGKFAEKRVELDKARQHALALIYDRVKYFYPYKPPAVSGAKFSEYNKVQKEVDARVAAVRKLWLDKTKTVLGPKTRKDIEALLWVENELGKMGEVTDRALSRVEWVRSIPAVAELSIRNYCKNAEEKARFVLYSKIEELNEALGEDLGPGEIEQVEITNSYRIMFAHRPLAISKKLHKAAQGHAEEMAALGYFSHTSPTEGRQTPYKRMRNEGYNYGISENIAGNPSAAGAHLRWCHSSGHHRNLLNAGHTEFGVGNSGRLWVQNFGRGQDYLDEADFPK